MAFLWIFFPVSSFKDHLDWSARMKGVKAILAFVLGAAYASVWWAVPMFPHYVNFVVAAGLLTAILIVFCVSWLIIYWE